MIRSFLPVLLVCFSTLAVSAQELNATVRLTVPKLQTTDPRVFQTLEQQIADFLNNQRWTELEYEQQERIECAVQINVTEELSRTQFKADIALQAVRPVFGSDYKTAVLTHVDKDVIFTYEEYQPLEDSRNFYRDNLSSVLSYYAMLIIGLDFDTFSELGGDPYFQAAQQIVNSIPPGVADQDGGWNSLAGNKTNRFWLMENLLSPKVRPFREAMYQYHRYGLDLMHKDAYQSQEVIMRSLTSVDQVRESYPTVMVTRMFVNAKSDEIIEIFKGADKSMKSLVSQVMRRLDVTNANKYNVLK